MAGRQEPLRVPVEERTQNFAEVERTLLPHQAMAEAARCLFCHDAPCVKGCPVGIDIPGFIKRIKTRNYPGAIKIIREANVLGGVCARVCPSAEQCEKNCSSSGLSEPIAIAALQRFVTDMEAAKGIKLPPQAESTGKKVAVIGSGPAGLSAAAELTRLGYSVTIYEAAHRPGGVMAYGIPPYRLPFIVLDQEIRPILERVELKAGCMVGKDISLEDLKKDFAAVFIGCGLGEPVALNIPGEELPGVVNAQDFLAAVNHAVENGCEKPTVGKRVAVLGGGNVAIDAACTAKRLGAEQVMVIYRRSEAEMPAWKSEVAFAREEGIEFRFLETPVAVLGNSVVSGLRLIRMALGEPDESGRRRPVPVAGSEFELAADMVIKALGQNAKPAFGLATDKKGLLLVNEEGQTSDPAVFAGGDAVNGGLTVVRAVAEGRRAAQGIDKYLRGAAQEVAATE